MNNVWTNKSIGEVFHCYESTGLVSNITQISTPVYKIIITIKHNTT